MLPVHEPEGAHGIPVLRAVPDAQVNVMRQLLVPDSQPKAKLCVDRKGTEGGTIKGIQGIMINSHEFLFSISRNQFFITFGILAVS
jgi:hypothetical protein